MKIIRLILSRTKKKREVYRPTHKTPADMETCGVYFSDEVKRELVKNREEIICHYSGLPSVQSYNKK